MPEAYGTLRHLSRARKPEHGRAPALGGDWKSGLGGGGRRGMARGRSAASTKAQRSPGRGAARAPHHLARARAPGMREWARARGAGAHALASAGAGARARARARREASARRRATPPPSAPATGSHAGWQRITYHPTHAHLAHPPLLSRPGAPSTVWKSGGAEVDRDISITSFAPPPPEGALGVGAPST